MGKSEDISRAIKDAYRSLVCETSLDDITVAMICQRVGLSRKTFYTRFQSSDDLLEAVIRDDLVEPIKQLYPVFGTSNTDFSVPFMNERVYRLLLEQKEFYIHVVTRNSVRIFVHAFKKCLMETHDFIRECCGGVCDERYGYASRFLAAAQTELIVQWIRGGMVTPPEDLGRWFSRWSQVCVDDIAGVV